MINPFLFFDLPVDFTVDLTLLYALFSAAKSLPDNFVQHSPQEQRLAMQKSAEVNDALQILKDPVLRADCIVALHTGESLNLESQSSKDMAFLMQQMQWREQLES